MAQKHVDEIMRGVQGAFEETQAHRFHPLSVWMGVARTLTLLSEACLAEEGRLKERLVAKVIEYYVPTRFTKIEKWLPPEQRGRVIEFRLPSKKSA